MGFFPSLAVAPIVLVGNKTDLMMDTQTILHLAESNQELITMDEGIAMAEKIGAYEYLECTALLNDGIMEVFECAVQAFFHV